MTWFTTWREHNRPQYAAHPTETAAAEHAKTKRAGGCEATHFWSTAATEENTP